MSDTAAFCPTCFARVGADSVPHAEAPPVSSAAEWLPPADLPAPQGSDSPPAPRWMGLSPNGLRIAIVLAIIGAFMLVGLVLGTSLRHSVSSRANITLNEYSALEVGMSQVQVEETLGLGGGYFQSGDENQRFHFTNPDGSYADVVFTNGSVSSLDQSGLSQSASERSKGGWGALLALTSLVSAVIWFVASAATLYVAVMLRGYHLSVKQVLGISCACSLVSLVPWVGGIASFCVYWALIQWWTAADWIEVLIIGFVRGLVASVIALPFGLGIMLGFSL